MATKKPKPGTKADLKMKLDSAMQLNSYLSRLSRAGLGRALGQSFDGDRNLYTTLGYKLEPEYVDYLNIYERDGIGTRVVDSVADEVWREHPIIFESEKKAEDEKAEPGPLQEKFKELSDKHDLWAQFNDLDRSLGISRFALLYLGLPGKPEEEVKGKAGKLAYVISCDEGTADVDESSIITDPDSERFGLPEYYSINIDDTGETRRRVHYTRVIHVKEGRQRYGGLGRVYGVPRMKKIINRLQDLEKVLGGGSEAYWLLIYRGMALMAKEGFSLPGKDTAEYETMQDEIDEYVHGLRRYIRLQGLDLQDLGGSPVDSRAQFDVIIEYISGSMRIPQRVLLGSERGNLASSSDDANFMDYIDSRRKNFAEPYILRPFLNRMDELGILKMPKGYYIDWPSLFQLTDLEKADLAGKVATAMGSASGGAPETIIPPEEFAKRYLNFVWTPAMKRELAESEEKAMGAEGAGGGFGGAQGGDQGGGGGFGGAQGGGNGNGSFAPNPAGELDLAQFRATIDAFGDSAKMANLRAGQRVMLPGDRWAPTNFGPVLRHNEHDHSVMVALRITPALRSELQEQYPIMDDATRDNLHITLAFLGDSRTLDIERAALAVFEFAREVKPIKTKLQGVARFVSDEEKDPIVATIDSPDFPDFRQALCESLERHGVPYHKNHGFIPHMTLAYIPAGDPMPLDTVDPLELNFSEVFLVDGGQWYGVELGFAPEPVPAGVGEALRQHHGGPGPHKSGSSQDVHGDPGAGSTSTSTTAKAGSQGGPAADDPFDEKGKGEFLKDWWTATESKRSKEEKDALYFYSDGGYRYMNDAYRDPDSLKNADEKELDFIDGVVFPSGAALEDHIRSTTVPENVRLFRGTNLTMDKDGREKYAGLVSNLLAKANNPSLEMEFSDAGFFSTSTDKKEASLFGDRFGDSPITDHSILFTIDTPKGTHAIPVVSDSYDEYEVLFGPGQRFRVADVSYKTNQVIPGVSEYDEYDFSVRLEAING